MIDAACRLILSLVLLSFSSWDAKAGSLSGKSEYFELYSEGIFSVFTVIEAHTQSSVWKKRARELTGKLQKAAMPKVPLDLKSALVDYKISFVFDPKCDAAAVFKEPENSKNLEICIKSQTDAEILRLAIHEFFHALHFVVHKGEPEWLREGLAVWFESFVLEIQNFEAVYAAMTESSTPFFGNYTIGEPSYEQYGHNFLFFRYFSEKCDEQAEQGVFIWDILRAPQDHFGIASLNWAIHRYQQSRTFLLDSCRDIGTMLLNFEIARVHNRDVEGPTGSSLFRVMPFTSNRMKDSKWDVKDIAKLPEYQPLVISKGILPNRELPIGEGSRWRRVFLQADYPYQVHLDTAPINTDLSREWREVIIRTRIFK